VPVSSQPEKVMARYRSYSIEFKRQIAGEYLGGDVSMHGLAKRHRISRQLIRLWVAKYEAGEFSEEAAMAASLLEVRSSDCSTRAQGRAAHHGE
jgi:transposase-like protein